MIDLYVSVLIVTPARCAPRTVKTGKPASGYVQSLQLLLRVQELCESQGGRPGLPVLMSLTVSVDVKQH